MKKIQLAGDQTLDELLTDIRACQLCASHLPLGPRPILRVAQGAKILIVGQAPGTRVHQSGVPWDDASGERLRSWLAMDKQQFYDEGQIAIIPMGFCYPGRGISGDLPPRKECAPTWLPLLQTHLGEIRTTLLIGQYAIEHYLGAARKATLTQTVQHWQAYAPDFFPLPHPSPRNNIWLKRNPWFNAEVVPALQAHLRTLS